MIRRLLLLMVMVLQGCGTTHYVPREYEISPERISSFTVKGHIEVTNLQTDSRQVVFYDGPGQEWVGDYKAVSDHLRDQMQKEIAKHTLLNPGPIKKSIGVQVVRLEGYNPIGAFHLSSAMDVSVVLGNGKTLVKHLKSATGGNMNRMLNGILALGTIDILNDLEVRQYLAE